MEHTPSYTLNNCCGANCSFLGYKPDEPCWGNVSCIDKEYHADGVFVGYQFGHECEGHLGYHNDLKYKEEPN